MYPACAQVMRKFTGSYRSYAPMLLLIGTDDEEVKPERCAQISEIAERNGSDWQFVLYPVWSIPTTRPRASANPWRPTSWRPRTANNARKPSSGNSSRVDGSGCRSQIIPAFSQREKEQGIRFSICVNLRHLRMNLASLIERPHRSGRFALRTPLVRGDTQWCAQADFQRADTYFPRA
jgi:hypothetical protein